MTPDQSRDVRRLLRGTFVPKSRAVESSSAPQNADASDLKAKDVPPFSNSRRPKILNTRGVAFGRASGDALDAFMKRTNRGTFVAETSHEHKTPSQGDAMEGEKRRTPRYIFFAAAELMEEKSEVRIASRLSELSLRGCYLDMMNPFPVGTSILLKVWTDESTVFQSNARVIYSQPNVGAGVQFVDVEPKYLAVLEHWLKEAATVS